MSSNSFFRKAIKASVLPLGMTALTRSADLVVLLYHRVGAGNREIDLGVEQFERQVAYLAGRGLAVTLDEALGKRGCGGVVITVDDGYRDFHDDVLPVLVKYRVPALLYLATGLVANGGPSKGDPDRLSWSQLREAVSTGLVAVGSHTHNHSDLSQASEQRAENEMRWSKELVEDRLGVPCRHFAYPWAVTGPAAERAAHRLFDSAALMWKTNRLGRLDPHRLGRTPVLRSDGQAFFRAKVRGMLDGEALAYHILRRGPWRRS